MKSDEASGRPGRLLDTRIARRPRPAIVAGWLRAAAFAVAAARHLGTAELARPALRWPGLGPVRPRWHRPIRAALRRNRRAKVAAGALWAARAEIAAKLLPSESLTTRPWLRSTRPHRHRPVHSVAALAGAFPWRTAPITAEIGTRRPLRKALIPTHAVRPAVMTMLHPRLRLVALWLILRTVVAGLTIAGGRWTVVLRTVARAALIAASIALRPAFTLALATRFFAALRLRSLLAWTFRTLALIAWALVALSLFTLAFRARSAVLGAAALAVAGLGFAFARTTIFALRTLTVARRTHLIGQDAAVAIAIHLAEEVGRLRDLVLIERAVVIRIERPEKAGHR